MLKREDLKVGMRVAVEDLYAIPDVGIILEDVRFDPETISNYGTVVKIGAKDLGAYSGVKGYLYFYLPYEEWLECYEDSKISLEDIE